MEDKSFESLIKGRMSNGTNPCQLNTFETSKSSLKTVICKRCGKRFKTNEDTEYCFECGKK
ncbi:MAG: hypothetical protein Q4P18_00095 [Methanobrevibacter sp.]|nr:hypothetical protein [Methanobrevibacter sp.]